VTSGNVYHIVANLPAKRVLFVPDRLMGQNLRDELKRRGVQKEIITSDGTCMVHDEFGPVEIAAARERYPGLKVVAHPECTPEVAAASDFVGSTGAMMKYVRRRAPYYLMLTECGLVGRLQVESPEGVHRRMPALSVHEAEFTRKSATPSAPRADKSSRWMRTCVAAPRCIERMFELAPTD
jgi:quinolinate synthase